MSAAGASSAARARSCSPCRCAPAQADETQTQEQKEHKYGADGMPHGWRDDPKVFIAIAPDGTVTVTNHRSEMGQGVRTSIALTVADELEADWPKVKVVQAWGDEAASATRTRTARVRCATSSSTSPRRAAAAMRAMLVEAAAKQWGVPASEVTAKNHTLTHAKSGKTLGYGAVAEAAGKLPVPATVTLKDPKDFRYIGTGKIGLIDNFDITTGKAVYGADTKLDGMLYAAIARPPVYGGTVKSFDDSDAKKVAGVVKIFKIDGAPIPPSSCRSAASRWWPRTPGRAQGPRGPEDHLGRRPNATYDTDVFRKELEETARKPGKVVRTQGDVDAAMAKAKKKVVAEYFVPHLVQAPMEPPAAIARVKDGVCEAWASTQGPQAANDRLMKALNLPDDKVTVNVTLLGGGFGRKSKPDYVVEAALCSREVGGAPVKLAWTRDDDIHHGYYHTISAERIEAGLDEKGMPVAWLHRSCAPTIGSIFAPDPKHELPFELGMGLVNTPFAIPNMRMENPEAAAHVRIGWFRSVSNIPHAFAIQSFVSELAHEAGRDPKDYLLDLIGPPKTIDPTAIGDVWNYGEDPSRYPIDTGRLRGVIEAAAKGAGWGRQMRRAGAWASPGTTASSPTRRSRPRWRSMRRAR